jgi:hypothetical protein
MLALFVVVASMSGCVRAYKQELYYDTKPNEAVFLIPMEESIEDQGSFNTSKDKDYYDSKLIRTTRVNLRQRWKSTGRLNSVGKWILKDKLIKVDLTPQSRKWTLDKDTGSTTKNDGFKLESKDSIAFSIGGVCTARITDSSLFLASYGEAMSLSKIMDNNIKTHFEGELTRGFADVALSTGREQKSSIADKAREVTAELFLKRGITIDTLMVTGGMKYEDAEIQKGINDEFIAGLKESVQEKENAARNKANDQMIRDANKKKEEADIFAKTAQIQTKMMQLQISLIDAETRKIYAQNWNGAYPEKMLAGTPDLMMVP